MGLHLKGAVLMFGQDDGAEWAWPLSVKAGTRPDRMPLMRRVPYTLSLELEQPLFTEEEGDDAVVSEAVGTALSMNVSAGGMLVIMNGAPPTQHVLKVRVPTPIKGIETPTLAEVRWSRKLPFPAPHSLYLVGLKFIV